MPQIAHFIQGFARFRAAHLTGGEQLVKQLGQGQFPKVLVVACCDSRADPAVLTNATLGELFVVRNVANLVPPCQNDGAFHGVSSAIEFGVLGLKVEHIVVLGHSQCGGVRAMIDEEQNSRFRFVAKWMEIAQPARERVCADLAGEPLEVRLRAVEQANIILSLENLMTFPWVAEAVEAGRLTLSGWYFDLRQGCLLGYDPAQGTFTPITTPN